MHSYCGLLTGTGSTEGSMQQRWFGWWSAPQFARGSGTVEPAGRSGWVQRGRCCMQPTSSRGSHARQTAACSLPPPPPGPRRQVQVQSAAGGVAPHWPRAGASAGACCMRAHGKAHFIRRSDLCDPTTPTRGRGGKWMARADHCKKTGFLSLCRVQARRAGAARSLLVLGRARVCLLCLMPWTHAAALHDSFWLLAAFTLPRAWWE
jgi:hypothetical protein